ncbi:MAG: lipoprotein-releasing system permease protein [Bacteroidetes bacterium HLUCCA01]|nr:MAG: lipoprotein-releasing system permease protein [Bacteroidetes bacterium HLUCCA01]
MNFEWFIAKRYFRSSRKDASFLSFIKFMAIAGVAVGSAGLLIALSVVQGFKHVIEEKILGFGTHFTIETYSDMPVYRADTLMAWVNTIPDIDRVQAVLYGQGMVQAGEQVEGTFLKGVPADEGDLSDIRNYITHGIYDLSVQASGKSGIVMGEKLARNLNAVVGQTISIYTIQGTPSPSNLPEIKQFELTGVYQTGIDRFDDVFALIDIQHASDLFGLPPPAATMIDIRVNSIENIPSVRAILAEKIDFPYFVQSIYQRYSNIFAWINLQAQTIPLVIGVLVIVAAFNLIGTILMMVLERVRDIGILKTIGTPDHKIRNIFLLEGLLVGVIGLSMGLLLAAMFNFIQAEYALIPLSEENYYMATAPVYPRLRDFVTVSIITITLCLLASWIPARFASRTNPLQVTNFGK